MCGIAGFTTFTGPRGDELPRLARMMDALAHRGPDGQGVYHDPAVALGHRRLSIIDVAGGAQPMASPDGRYHIAYNGEVYNYLELRRTLQDRGHTFRTQSDTEVLLACFLADGPAALQKIDGMFAFAIWDRRERELFLARDRIGIKPLYFATRGPDLLFASELKALLAHGDISRELSPPSVSKYFSFGYIPAPHTIFAAVHKLEPGTFLTFSAKGLSKSIYWDVPLQDRTVSPRRIDESAAGVLGLLGDSVRRQLRSDVPVGVFLSGGIDSSAVAALAAQASGRRLMSFSIGFDNPSYDESPYARRVAQLVGTEHHALTVTLRDVVGAFPAVMRVLDEPLADASILPTYLLCQASARHV
jgi:asparagine synthase (glutamine-hydrolysing)